MVLTFNGAPGSTYTAIGTHRGYITITYDLADTRPGQNFTQSDDYYNFSRFSQGTTAPEIYNGSYSWFGLGPDTPARTELLRVGNTTDSETVPPGCPTSIVLDQTWNQPLSSDFPIVLTGVGILTSMKVGPASINFHGVTISETVTPATNDCPISIKAATDFPSTQSNFIIGTGVQWEMNPYGQVVDAFYDQHVFKSRLSVLDGTGAGTCSSSATKT